MNIKLSMMGGIVLFLCNIPLFSQPKKSEKPIKVLIVDGQNNHVQWPKITYMMKQYLEESGEFLVDVKRTRYTWKGEEFLKKYKLDNADSTESVKEAQTDSMFRPNFSAYNVVICNFGWKAAPWTAETQADFEQYMKKGGGLVVVHAANNSFPEWPAYNKMIALGGWGDRSEKDGPYIYYDEEGKLVRDTKAGKAGGHGEQREFLVTMRNANHPITKGMPEKWLHSKDELYCRLRGPAENMDVLATSFSPKDNKGTDRNEPMMMAINYEKGRIFHTALGHVDYSVECVGFITCLLRGTQWAATGKVNIPIPPDFPTETKVSVRKFVEKEK
jgi:uncharacterized protein